MKENLMELIGNTPMIHIKGFEKENKHCARIFAKLEYLNPFGSIKDRAALQIIKDAEKNGELGKEFTLIEATSGNMGIALSALSALKGYKSIMVMPENTSLKKQELMKKYGAKVILTPRADGIKGSVEKAEQIADNNKVFYVNQFNNTSSVVAHRNATAVEIYSQMKGKVDVVITGIGSGGTISGIAEFMKSVNRSIKIVGVLPESFPHSIEGIGAGFTPKILNSELIDIILKVTNKEAECARCLLCKTDGIFPGLSSGAVLAAANKLATIREYNNKNIIIIFADSGERYI